MHTQNNKHNLQKTNGASSPSTSIQSDHEFEIGRFANFTLWFSKPLHLFLIFKQNNLSRSITFETIEFSYWTKINSMAGFGPILDCYNPKLIRIVINRSFF